MDTQTPAQGESKRACTDILLYMIFREYPQHRGIADLFALHIMSAIASQSFLRESHFIDSVLLTGYWWVCLHPGKTKIDAVKTADVECKLRYALMCVLCFSRACVYVHV
eukprot:scpid102831/ scgid13898/ 